MGCGIRVPVDGRRDGMVAGMNKSRHVTSSTQDAALLETVRSTFVYDQETGSLFRRMAGGNRKEVGSQRKDGYLNLNFSGRNYLIHRLVWFMHYGVWPRHQIDHINGIRNDNRMENLRDVPNKENARNARLAVNNTSGYVGVWKNANGRWISEWCEGGKRKTKYFRDCNEAAEHAASIRARLGFGPTSGKVVPLAMAKDTPVKGVYPVKGSNKFRAVAGKNYKLYHLGTFDTVEEAIEARRKFYEVKHDY